MDEDLEGRVLSGSSGLFQVQAAGGRYLCTIKGKRLEVGERVHNPITVGDRVRIRVTEDGPEGGRATILSILERSSLFTRWNKRTRAPQLMAANADLLVCVSSAASPPFRPRFLDRMMVAGEAGGLEPLVLLNKADLGVPPEVEDRLAAYEELGYPVIVCSAENGRGIGPLVDRIGSRLAVFAGQSGVGKSSILNRLDPGLDLRVGDISAKHDRGVHTTTGAQLHRLAGGLEIVDTPGLRELELAGIEPADLRHYYREFRGASEKCEYDTCLHVDEETCGVREAASAGAIHPDRYESYLRTYEQVLEAARDRLEQRD